LQTSQSSQPKENALNSYLDEEIAEGLKAAEELPKEESPLNDYE